MSAVIICFRPSSVTLSELCRIMRADLGLLAGCQQRRLLQLESAAGKAKEQQDDRDVDDVTAVAALVTPDQPDQGGQQIGPCGVLTDASTLPEFLGDCPDHESAESETQPRAPDPNPEGDGRSSDQQAAQNRKHELVAQIDERRLAPGQQRADAGENEHRQSDWDHPLVEERRPDGDALARHSLAERREHRGKQHEAGAEEQNPVVEQERGFTRQPESSSLRARSSGIR